MNRIKPSSQLLEKIHKSITRTGIDIAIESYRNNKTISRLKLERKPTRIQFIEDLKLPSKLYKFLYSPVSNENPTPKEIRKERIESIILNNQLFLSSGSDFNDPFDVFPSFKTEYSKSKVIEIQTMSAKLHKIPKKEIDSFIRYNTAEFFKNPQAGIERLTSALRNATYKTGIFCFTEELHNILMWSHYAENHKGICIEFDMSEDIEIACNIQPIKYSNTRPIIDIFDRFKKENYSDFYMIKSLDWSYEKEYRLTYNEKAHMLINCSDKLISKVIVGAKASTETLAYLSDINEKRESKGFPRFEIAQAKLSDTEYKIEVHPI